ncbi:MAG: SH3 domain-containing protein [Caldilineaceae bacterium]|nr:SH3 domain-containing protein [Caldilineaceae bacterium]
MTTRSHLSHAAIAVILLLVVGVLAGCGGSGPEPTPTPTKTPAGALPAETPAPAVTPAQPATEPVVEQPATEAPTTAPAAETETIGVITATQLNVRSAPNSDAEIVATVNEGEEYKIAANSEDGQWVQLDNDGTLLGWAAAEFVDVRTVAVSDGGDAQAAAPTATADGSQTAPVGSGNYLPATMTSPDFGTQAFLWWREEVADRDLGLIKDADFRWVKQTFAWETIEAPTKGQFDWSISDRVVQHTNNAELKLLARLSSDPELGAKFWAGHPPANGDNFADFAFAMAQRYNCTPQAVGCIQAYQIWNEPNLAREWGGNPPNPAQYADFLSKAYAAIKRGNPNAIVISAGMAPTGDCCTAAMPDDQFYEGMYQAMGGNSTGYFDMLGVHGAGFAAPPELDPATAASDQKYGGYRFFAFRHVEDIRAIMEKYGDGAKQIVLLEFGWTYDSVNPDYKWHGADAGIDMFVQADYLKRAYQYAAANWQPWIGLMSLITMPNIDWLADGNPQDEEQYWWAIMDPGYPDTFWRPAYIELCIYFNGMDGQRCKYDPN